jgi:hypothetical protein
MDHELRLQLSEEGADAERLAVLTGYLRTDLLQLDVDNVTMLPVGEPPLGTRGTDVAAVGGLLVTFSESAEGILSVINSIRDWLRRGQENQRRVRVEVDGDKLELSQASAADQQQLVELFLSRHAPAEGA